MSEQTNELHHRTSIQNTKKDEHMGMVAEAITLGIPEVHKKFLTSKQTYTANPFSTNSLTLRQQAFVIRPTASKITFLKYIFSAF